jgi:predicted ATPase
MIPQLDMLTIANFRSIKGTINIPLNAPIILVHGLNGTGKTSLLSALELALTGDIAAMRRDDPNFAQHLVHQGAKQATIRFSGPGIMDNASPTVIESGEIRQHPISILRMPSSSQSVASWRNRCSAGCWRFTPGPIRTPTVR